MKYRHSFHAGNFADVHKHVTLLALLAALQRKEKGFLYLETHAGRGTYNLSARTGETERESASGIERFTRVAHQAPELKEYERLVDAHRASLRNPHAYPGSPVLAAQCLRPQDRAVFVELQPEEARALERTFERASAEHPDALPRVHVESGDGFERLRAHLPPAERRGLTFIDPPYEETRQDFVRINGAIAEALRRFRTGIVAVWYPIKNERETRAWLKALAQRLGSEMLVSELWLFPPDSRVSLNGSGMLIVNPPYLLAERMRQWLPELLACLDTDKSGGTDIRGYAAQAR